MPISHSFKAIFIHIPKNAGQSIEKTLEMYGGKPEDTLWGRVQNRYVLQHLTAAQLIQTQLIPEETWNTYFKFAVVRNPWSKAVSEYNWYLRYGPTIDFSHWVDTLERRLDINSAIHMKEIGHNVEQHRFVFDRAGDLMVDRLLRFEALERDFSMICADNKWNVKLLYEEATKTQSNVAFQDYYSEATALKIQQIYREDIERFGYSLEQTFAGKFQF